MSVPSGVSARPSSSDGLTPGDLAERRRRCCVIPTPQRAPEEEGLGGRAVTVACATALCAPSWRGAVHSADIEYAMGNLDLDKRYTWEPADYEVSKTMQAYFVNFIKTFNPNGPGLPNWPAYRTDNSYERMRIDVKSQAEPEGDRDRYLAIEAATAGR